MTFRPRRRSVCRRSSGDAAQTKPSLRIYAAGDAASPGPPLTPVSSHDAKCWPGTCWKATEQARLSRCSECGLHHSAHCGCRADRGTCAEAGPQVPHTGAKGPGLVHGPAGGRAVAMLLQRPLRRTSRASWGIAARSLAERIIRTRGADVGIEAARGNPIAAQCLHATCVLRRPIRRYNHVFSRPTPEAVLVT
jgi:hypothetical protein